jgi:hypothetical protein
LENLNDIDDKEKSIILLIEPWIKLDSVWLVTRYHISEFKIYNIVALARAVPRSMDTVIRVSTVDLVHTAP